MKTKIATNNGIYLDTSKNAHGKPRRLFLAEVRILDRRVRKRFQTREEVQNWIKRTIKQQEARYV